MFFFIKFDIPLVSIFVFLFLSRTNLCSNSSSLQHWARPSLFTFLCVLFPLLFYFLLIYIFFKLVCMFIWSLFISPICCALLSRLSLLFGPSSKYCALHVPTPRCRIVALLESSASIQTFFTNWHSCWMQDQRLVRWRSYQVAASNIVRHLIPPFCHSMLFLVTFCTACILRSESKMSRTLCCCFCRQVAHVFVLQCEALSLEDNYRMKFFSTDVEFNSSKTRVG